MQETHTIEIPVLGMTCADCAQDVSKAIEVVPGVEKVEVFLSSEKAIISFDSSKTDAETIKRAVEGAGYTVTRKATSEPDSREPALENFTKSILKLLGIVFSVVLFIVVIGEWLGLFEAVTRHVPWPVGVVIVLLGGYRIFWSVIQSALKGRITSHALMSIGVIAALVVGEWATAVIIVFFMRVGEYAEHFTVEHARRAIKDLSEMAPKLARVERAGAEIKLPIAEVVPGDSVIVRPGETIPVDGEVISGQATIDQSAITGESMPIDAGPGAKVYAATIASLGSLRVRTTRVGIDSTFGRVIKLVERAEGNQAQLERVADRFSAYYLPFVLVIGAFTFILRHDPLATAAVLAVACSCSFALATPIAMLASIGALAKRGLMVKGGKYLELLAHADVLLIDKTGTLTLGKPTLTDLIALGGRSENEILSLAASAERYSEHPLAEAVRKAASARNLTLLEPQDFEANPGIGVKAKIADKILRVGSRRILPSEFISPDAQRLEAQGKTLLFVVEENNLIGILSLADTLRQDAPQALSAIRGLGINQIELLTGDNEKTAAAIAGPLGISYRASLLPEDKIEVVRNHQAKGNRVIMVGDGVNDAPALAQADVGIAMGVVGSDIAIEAAHVSLMREDWMLIPELLYSARRTMRVVKGNIAFTTVYNLGGLLLAALGIIPPALAAAAQALPDLGILGNSARLLRSK